MRAFLRTGCRKGHARRAFTVLESMVAIGVLLVVAGLLAELGMLTLVEKQRNSGRQQVQEAALNILEAARASAWETLTPDWAKAQRLPESLAADLEIAELVVQIDPEPARPLCRRISVEVRWLQDGKPTRPVKFVSLLSARRTARPGGKP
ncbi:MAG TPA: type II secretion system protein [Gemmataceae bacterium]|jgi:type II secretory pathway pseudopilin PulG|nr:type II secretion system protein [Gemmataceae bacterium]